MEAIQCRRAERAPRIAPRVWRMALYLLGTELIIGLLFAISTVSHVDADLSLDARTRRMTQSLAAQEMIWDTHSEWSVPLDSPALEGREVMFF
jgi:hypothetical protein